jgi:hypothetical protein
VAAHRRYLGWGVFLVCLGLVPLAVQLAWIDARTAAALLRFWPFILVGIGISLALRITRYQVVGSVISGAATGLVFGAFFAGGIASPSVICAGDQPRSAPATQSGAFDSSSVQVNLELTCGEVDVTRTSAPAWSTIVATDGDSPVVQADASSLDVRSSDARFASPFTGGSNERWHVTLPAAATVSAGLTLNAASGDIALGHGQVSSVSSTLNGSDATLDLTGTSAASSLGSTLNASSMRLILPASPVHANVTLNVSSLTICVPPTTPLAIDYTNTLGTNNFVSAGLVGSGQGWTTADLGAPTSELHITSNLSSVSLERSGECP